MSRRKNSLLVIGIAAMCMIAAIPEAHPQETRSQSSAEIPNAPWKNVTINYFRFRAMSDIAITPENITHEQSLRITNKADYDTFEACIHDRMVVVEKGVYTFDRLGTRLRIEDRNRKQILLVDDKGVVKTPKEEYILTPASFLDLNNFLNHLAETTSEHSSAPN